MVRCPDAAPLSDSQATLGSQIFSRCGSCLVVGDVVDEYVDREPHLELSLVLVPVNVGLQVYPRDVSVQDDALGQVVNSEENLPKGGYK